MSHSPCAFWIKDITTTLRPHKIKNRKILNHHHSIGRTKTYNYNVTRKNKKIATRKKLATNNKVLVHTGSSHFSKNYQQYRYRYTRQFEKLNRHPVGSVNICSSLFLLELHAWLIVQQQTAWCICFTIALVKIS